MSEGESSSVFLSKPQRIGALEAFAVHSAAVGSAHVIAVVAEGSLAAWGCNEFGQLGENHHLSARAHVQHQYWKHTLTGWQLCCTWLQSLKAKVLFDLAAGRL